MEKLDVKKCLKCGALVKVFKNCECKECGIKCCGENMEMLIPNSDDGAIEKHIPTYEIKDGEIVVTVNHVMEEDHYIEWISICFDNKEHTIYLKPGEKAEMHDKYIQGSIIYAYCNKHQLWKKEVE